MSSNTPEKILVSACLIGLCTRYDGRIKPSSACLQRVSGRHWIPVCPEQLGGLPTPRTAVDLVGGDGHDVLTEQAEVINRDGLNVTENFIKGAEQCLALAEAQQISTAFLKAKSPSCGLNPKIGVTAALLKEHGIRIIEF